MAYTLSFSCGLGVSSCSFQYTYNGIARTTNGSNVNITFDEGTVVYLTAISFTNGYGYPATVTNLGSGGAYVHESASTSKWNFNGGYGVAPPVQGYSIVATKTASEDTTDGYVWILHNNNQWVKAVPYIYMGASGWQQVTPYVYMGASGWQQAK